MSFEKIKISIIMTLKELIRNRVAIILFFLIPALFYLIIYLTNTHRLISFKLASVNEGVYIEVSERNESFIFIGLAAVGLLSSFLSLNLVQKHSSVNRRLVLCGYSSAELILSKLSVLVFAVMLIVLFVSLLLILFFIPTNLFFVIMGFFLGGYVYGCYGLLIGSIFKRELEGILFIVLMANIDAGWLQNPVYYADSQNQLIIKILPAFFPSQVSMISAFTSYPVYVPLFGSIIYGSILLIASMYIYHLKMK